MNPDAFMDLYDYVDELTRAHTHREPYTYELRTTKVSVRHTTEVPPLLQQLHLASPSGRGEELGGGGYESRPATSVDSLDALAWIDREAARWVRNLGEDDPGDLWDPTTQSSLLGTGAIRCVQMLGGLSANLIRCRKPGKGCCDYHQLERDVRRWWAIARVVTGWDSPAWRPDNTCPMCGARGKLRVRLVGQTAFCSECREAWDPTNIGLLAEHIRAEAAGERRTPTATWCWCPWPRPMVEAWPSLCPACASPWCNRAGWVKALEGPTGGPEHSFSVDIDGRMGA